MAWYLREKHDFHEGKSKIFLILLLFAHYLPIYPK